MTGALMSEGNWLTSLCEQSSLLEVPATYRTALWRPKAHLPEEVKILQH